MNVELNTIQSLKLLSLNLNGDCSASFEETQGELLERDLWSFGFFWDEVVKQFSTVENLYAAISDIKEKIVLTRETYRDIAFRFCRFDLISNPHRGVSGSYLLVDQNGKCSFIAKPLDEDGGCINNSEYATPFIMSPFRSSIPLYEGAMREVLASIIAEKIQVGSIVPKTVLGMIESDQFHDFSFDISSEETFRYWKQFDTIEREKLCSVQEFIEDGKSLFEAIHELEMANLSDEEIAARFDQSDFEDANLLLWVSYDTDGHMGNFIVYPKGIDEIGNEILGLKKIDNSLAFPEKNESFRNNLSYLPNAKIPLSDAAKEKIAKIEVESLAKEFEKLGLDGAIPALKERLSFLKEFVQKEGITIKEISKKMANIGRKK